MEVTAVKNRKVVVLLLILALLLAACGGEATAPGPALVPVPKATNPVNEEKTYNEGDCIYYTIYFQSSSTTLLVCLDGAGPNGASIRGITGLLQAGDPIIRDVAGEQWEIGKIISIANYSAVILIYDKAKIYKPNL